jgi:hypothetical protein
MNWWLTLCTLAGLLMSATRSPGQSTTKPESIEVRIHPMGWEEPALKYRLLPAALDQTPGNAATLYMMTFSMVQSTVNSWSHERNETFDNLLQASPEDLDAQKAQTFLAPRRLEDLEVASRRSTCDWDPANREQGYQALLPYLSYARMTAQMLSLQIKLDIKERRFDHAIEMLRAGFTLADNLQHEPIVVQCLVAASIREIFLNDLRTLIQRPGAPNLYWPLANLHGSADQWGRIMQAERDELFYTFPPLKHPKDMSAQQSRNLIDELCKYLDLAGRPPQYQEISRQGQIILQMIRGYPQAKAWLVHQGMTADQVEAMPANTVVLTWYVDQYWKQTEEIEKWTGLPLWEALPGIRRELSSIRNNDPGLNPLKQLLPALSRAYLRISMGDRERAMLQTVEAIRGYAAAHAGSAPNSLGDLSPATPAPLDPLLGKPFEYSVERGVTTLHAAAPAGESQEYESVYHVQIQPG